MIQRRHTIDPPGGGDAAGVPPAPSTFYVRRGPNQNRTQTRSTRRLLGLSFIALPLVFFGGKKLHSLRGKDGESPAHDDDLAPQRECNWKCYLDNYPDLRKNGLTEETSKHHYENGGAEAGRDCRCSVVAGRCKYANDTGEMVEIRPEMGGRATYARQVASTKLLHELKLDGPTRRPIWTRAVIDELDSLVASGRTTSCPDYPHSAEDIKVALGLVKEKYARAFSSGARIGVVSAISPWVEHVVKSMGAESVMSIDYNAPIVCGINWIESRGVSAFAAEEGAYDLLVSFSGIEHTGLGRYGDPINPTGDIEAMGQMHRALRPGGLLLLGIPTANVTSVVGKAHRLYGPERLAWMLEEGNFYFRARVWDGRIFGGWSDVHKEPPLFPTADKLESGIHDWMNQHVLVLQKPQGIGSEGLPIGIKPGLRHLPWH